MSTTARRRHRLRQVCPDVGATSRRHVPTVSKPSCAYTPACEVHLETCCLVSEADDSVTRRRLRCLNPAFWRREPTESSAPTDLAGKSSPPAACRPSAEPAPPTFTFRVRRAAGFVLARPPPLCSCVPLQAFASTNRWWRAATVSGDDESTLQRLHAYRMRTMTVPFGVHVWPKRAARAAGLARARAADLRRFGS